MVGRRLRFPGSVWNLRWYCLFFLILASGFRLQFGVDFTDDAFYAAVPASYVAGNLPFEFENSTQQGAAVLMWPLSWLHARLVGSHLGIILFYRVVLLLLTLLSAGFIYRALRRHASASVAGVLCLLPIAFAPFEIKTLSYNSIGSLCWGTGVLILFLGAGGLLELVVAGVIFGIGIIAYPSLVLPVLATVPLSAWMVRATSERELSLRDCARRQLPFFVSLVVFGILTIIGFSFFGFEAVANVFLRSARLGIQSGGIEKLLSVFEYWVVRIKGLLLSPRGAVFFVFAIWGLWRFRKSRKKGGEVFYSLLALSFVGCLKRSSLDSLFNLSVISIAALILVSFFIDDQSKRLRLMPFFFVSGLCVFASLMFALTSANGAMNSALGLLAVPIAALTGISWIIGFGSTGGLFEQLPGIVIASGLMFVQFQNVYRDDSIPNLTVRVRSGPFFGLRTSPFKADLLERFQEDLQKVSRNSENKTLLVYDNFPAGYLMSPLRPMTAAVWLPPYRDYPMIPRNEYIEFHRKTGHMPDIVMELWENPVSIRENVRYADHEKDSFRGWFLKQGYDVVVQREFYRVLMRPKAR